MAPLPEGFDPKRLFHIGYVVANMDRALKIWTAMGAELLVPPAPDPIQKVSCALLTLSGAVHIELIAPLEDDSPVRTRLAKGGGLDHVCLFSDDLAADLSALEDRGGLIVVQPCYGAVFDRQLAFVMTRGGLVVELMSRPPVGRLQPDPLAAMLLAKLE
ncbi:hypothetical protein ASD80_06720 [Devosia sp. Root635]|nr:hypothetical protein ASD80_06720 [Devosia sp. Root635]